ncbi:MAG: hypothetical protein GX892_09315 [Thermoanaerobacteraceae bacterium]|jgi:hypothetical protein|nr:hypothetical protein [Thermoanaerobacteraceae bacterium]
MAKRPGRTAYLERKRRVEERARNRFEIIIGKPKRWQRYDPERMSPGKLVAWAEIRTKDGGGSGIC